MLTLPLNPNEAAVKADLQILRVYLRRRSIRDTAAELHISYYKIRMAIGRFRAALDAADRRN